MHHHAARLAGEVFGRILDREADVDGYKYLVHCFESGSKSIRQIIVDFIVSDEFIVRFLTGRSSASTANLVTRLLLGRPIREQDVDPAVILLVRSGLREFARRIVNSQEYLQTVGVDRVPPFGHAAAQDHDRYADWSTDENAR